jgi:hypothetical protein
MKYFVILSVGTLAVVFGLGVIASAVTPPAAEQPQAQIQQKI